MTQREASLPAAATCDQCKNSGIIVIGHGDATFVQKCSCGCSSGRDYMVEMGLYAAPIIFAGLVALILSH